LAVTGQTIDISGFTRRQKDFYANLFWETVQRYKDSGKDRMILGIAGPTGAGKSVVSVLFKEFAQQAHLPFTFDVVTIDAYHYPNSHLLSHLSEGMPLKQVKGRFDTYDVASLINDLKAFATGQTMAFPAYCRKLHDPVPDSIRCSAPAALLAVEGLWLLSDIGGWDGVHPWLDYSYFIDADRERTRDGVLKRHMRGGRTLESATKHYDEVDAKNSELVLQTRHKADKIIPPYYLIP